MLMSSLYVFHFGFYLFVAIRVYLRPVKSKARVRKIHVKTKKFRLHIERKKVVDDL